ncbi:hypothetical protein DICA4_D21286 [Diutina catenulata]
MNSNAQAAALSAFKALNKPRDGPPPPAGVPGTKPRARLTKQPAKPVATTPGSQSAPSSKASSSAGHSQPPSRPSGSSRSVSPYYRLNGDSAQQPLAVPKQPFAAPRSPSSGPKQPSGMPRSPSSGPKSPLAAPKSPVPAAAVATPQQTSVATEKAATPATAPPAQNATPSHTATPVRSTTPARSTTPSGSLSEPSPPPEATQAAQVAQEEYCEYKHAATPSTPQPPQIASPTPSSRPPSHWSASGPPQPVLDTPRASSAPETDDHPTISTPGSFLRQAPRDRKSMGLALAAASRASEPQPPALPRSATVTGSLTTQPLEPGFEPQPPRTSPRLPASDSSQSLRSYLSSPSPKVSSSDMIKSVKQSISAHQVTQQQRDDQRAKRLSANLDPQCMIKSLKTSLASQQKKGETRPDPHASTRLQQFRDSVDIKRIHTPVEPQDNPEVWHEHARNVELYHQMLHDGTLDGTLDASDASSSGHEYPFPVVDSSSETSSIVSAMSATPSAAPSDNPPHIVVSDHNSGSPWPSPCPSPLAPPTPPIARSVSNTSSPVMLPPSSQPVHFTRAAASSAESLSLAPVSVPSAAATTRAAAVGSVASPPTPIIPGAATVASTPTNRPESPYDSEVPSPPRPPSIISNQRTGSVESIKTRGSLDEPGGRNPSVGSSTASFGATLSPSQTAVSAPVDPPARQPRRKPPPDYIALPRASDTDTDLESVKTPSTETAPPPVVPSFPRFPEISKHKNKAPPKYSQESLLLSEAEEEEEYDEPEPAAPHQQPAQAQVAFKTTMRKTKRSDKKNLFNENKPWKNHTELNYLSEAERKRYEGVWVSNRGSYIGAIVTRLAGVCYDDDATAESPSNSDTGSNPSLMAAKGASSECDQRQDYHGVFHAEVGQLMAAPVVKRIWERSRLPDQTLEQIWSLVDQRHDGTLSKAEFLVGMWLIDQCLYGRKLPRKVEQSVWDHLGYYGFNVNVNLKKKR